MEIPLASAIVQGLNLQDTATKNYFIAFTDDLWEDIDFLNFPTTHPGNWMAMAGNPEQANARDRVFAEVSRARRELMEEQMAAAPPW